MSITLDATEAFAVATALHAGFQATVTVVVYPALVEVGVDRWTTAHLLHSRRITLVVGPVYAALLGSGGWLVATGTSAAGWLALGLTLAALAVTAALAAPLHGRLGDPRPEQLRRLLVVDRLRCGFAVAGLVAALVALTT